MRKFIALSCVVGWFAFWAFGLIALFGGIDDAQVVAAVLLAFGGLVMGMTSYLKLSVPTGPV